jgi:hypothetical protein
MRETKFACLIPPFVLVLTVIGLSLCAPAMALSSPDTASSSSRGRPVSVFLDDLPIDFPIDPFIQDGTTMVPLRALSEALGFEVTWHEGGTIVCEKQGSTIGLAIGTHIVTVNGSEVTLPEPPGLVDGHTVVPLRFWSEAMDYAVRWDPTSFSAFVVSPKERIPVWGFYAHGSTEYSSWEDFFGDRYPYPLVPGPDSPASNIAGAILGWFAVDGTGRVTDNDTESGFRRPAAWGSAMIGIEAGGSKAVAMYFAQNNEGCLSSLLADPIKREHLAVSIASSAASFDGAAIDFEGLGPDASISETDAANFTEFLKALKTYLQGTPLTVVVHPLNSHYQGYDHERIGELADSVILMAYGYEDPLTPTPTAPWDKVREAVELELEKVPSEKLILGIPSYGTVYAVEKEPPTQTQGGDGDAGSEDSAGGAPGTKIVSRPAARDPVGPDPQTPATYDPYLLCHYSSWESEGVTYHAFTESNRSLAARASLAKRYGLAGIAIWRLGYLQAGWLQTLLEVASPLR